ncbi:MAG: SDR family NAD(P)-dependent oxidoreductase, partial [Anaerolineae bacterium]|nr:SDR family NAD(P)-dependent oxidoreductase [Anaerolineae bacterium]
MRLQDKVALITGASSGIGRETALLFAQEGASITVVDINDEGGQETVRMVEQLGGRAIYVRADVAKAAD